MKFSKAPNRRRKPFTTRKPRVTRPKISSAIKSYVKKSLHAEIENKCVQINFGNSFGNVNESPDFNAYPMCPTAGFWTLSAGVGQGARLGNIVRPVKVMLNYILRPLPYDALVTPVPQPSEVQLMLGHLKSCPTDVPNSLDIQNLFQSGSTVAIPSGSLRDIISVINTDYWVIKKRWTHKIGYASSDGTGSNASSQYFANNDFKLNHVKRMDITSMIPKKIVFNDSNASSFSKNLFLMYYAVSASGATYGANTLAANIEFWVDFHYEDA